MDLAPGTAVTTRPDRLSPGHWLGHVCSFLEWVILATNCSAMHPTGLLPHD
jgi:hypothetical protein